MPNKTSLSTTHAILITGGAGYIGSHTVVQLLEAGTQVIVLDNLSNSKAEAINRISKITGKAPVFIEGDVRNTKLLDKIFSTYLINAVIHFAGLKSVSESETNPSRYYDHNVHGSINLLLAMERASVRTFVFSSSATVYGEHADPQYRESMPTQPFNPYGRTKLMVEAFLQDLQKSNSAWRIAILRYFNPVGAHHSGLIGEDPNGVPNNLMPFIAQVAIGKRPSLSVFGGDYPTADGTARRDYIHVDDLARGHLAALSHINKTPGIITINLGSGKPASVLDMIHAFELASGKSIPHNIVSRRAGDLPEYYAEPSLAKLVLGWEVQHDIHRMCIDVWRWQSKNPNGYDH